MKSIENFAERNAITSVRRFAEKAINIDSKIHSSLRPVAMRKMLINCVSLYFLSNGYYLSQNNGVQPVVVNIAENVGIHRFKRFPIRPRVHDRFIEDSSLVDRKKYWHRNFILVFISRFAAAGELQVIDRKLQPKFDCCLWSFQNELFY